MAKRMITLLGALLFLGASAFATCSSPGLVDGIGNAPSIGSQAAVTINPASGCVLSKFTVHASMQRYSGSVANGSLLQIWTGTCGSGAALFTTQMIVTGTVGSTDRYDLNIPLNVVSNLGQEVCLQFDSGHTGVQETVYLEATNQ